MKYNFLEAEENFDLQKKSLSTEENAETSKVANPYFTSNTDTLESSEEVPTEPSDKYDDDYDYSDEQSKSKKPLIIILAIVVFSALVYFAFSFFASSSVEKLPEIKKPVAVKDSVKIIPIPTQTLQLAGHRNSSFSYINSLLTSLSNGNNFSQIKYQSNIYTLELFSENRDKTAQFVKSLRKLFDTVNVESTKPRNSPDGGLTRVYSVNSPSSSQASFRKGQSENEIISAIRSKLQSNGLSQTELSAESVASLKILYVQARGSKQAITSFLQNTNASLKNVALLSFTLSPTNLKTNNNNNLFIKMRLQILPNE